MSYWDQFLFCPTFLAYSSIHVAVNRMTHILEMDKFVMGYADCKCLTAWFKRQTSFNSKLGPLSDTLQAGA